MSNFNSPSSWLFYAYREWICTVQPKCHIVVNLSAVPHLKDSSENGEHVVLNVSDSATREFTYLADGVSFKTTFSGRPMDIMLKYEDIVGFVTPTIPEFSEIEGGLLELNTVHVLRPGEVHLVSFVSMPEQEPEAVKDTPSKDNVSRPNFLRVVK